ncbi:MAG: YdeI/OmpD-associated family protein [Acidobacteria bacterium]|nr:YdeI/OmpD-associated family protein [Acidobacteriota bacterium]
MYPPDVPGKTFNATVLQDEGSTATGIEVPFDPKEAFGKVRAPVKVTLRGHTFRTTVFRMSGMTFIPLNKLNRTAAGVEADDRVRVVMELDTAPRTITPPPELAAEAKLASAWEQLSYTAQRENAEAISGAKRPETRQRSLAKTLDLLRQRAT